MYEHLEVDIELASREQVDYEKHQCAPREDVRQSAGTHASAKKAA